MNMRIVRNSILFCVLQLAIYTGVSSQMVFVKDTIWRTPTDKLVSKVLSEVVTDVGPGSSQGLPLSVTYASRFYPLSNNRILLLFDVRNMFVEFTPTFTNIDHGTRFTEVRLPDPPGNSSYLQWELDYRDTNTMYVIADGRDYFNYDVYPES
ncbi:MAG: hypothetical protein HYX66_02150 [Ignavibacteria bacterium]|nr:hypothetical protein [Ignavibacteria bacterium]